MISVRFSTEHLWAELQQRYGHNTAMRKAMENYRITYSQDITMERKQNMAPSPGQPFNGQGVRRISRLNMVKSKMRIATWNVRSLYAAGKLDNLIKETKRLKVDIMGISELRWPDSGICRNEHGTLYYSGSDPQDRDHRNGVGIFVSAAHCGAVISHTPITDRIMLLQLQGQPFKLNIIQLYAPTAEKRYDNEVENLYSLLDTVLEKLNKDDITLIIGDFNSKIGQGTRQDLVGDFGLGTTNHRGDRLFEFCVERDLVITNTWFRLPKRRLYTWTSPAEGNNQEPIRNQIDYMLVKKRFRNCVTRVTTYPGADIGSDHVPLVAEIKLKLKKIRKEQKNLRIDTEVLKNSQTREQVRQELNNELATSTNGSYKEVEHLWLDLKNIFTGVCNRNMQSTNRVKKKRWMTDEILNMMEDRRLAKGNKEEYNRINRNIKREIKHAKENWMRDRCREMEELEERHDAFQMHKKVKEVTGNYKRNQAFPLFDSQNCPVVDEEETKITWEQYIKNLFSDNRPDHRNNQDVTQGPEILKDEVRHAISIAKNKKAPGPDGIPVEILKLIEDENLNHITKLFNMIYNTGKIPEDWLRSTFVTIPKKSRPKTCSDYRLISLMSHMLKTLLRIIHARIRKKCEYDLDDAQFGFRNAFGTREALFAVNVLLQKCRDQRKDVFACFIDYEKAFDRVQHSKLVEILRQIQLDEKDIRLIENLYWGQTAEIRVGTLKTDAVKIQRGVRQGCILSPLLFNLYSDKIFKDALEDTDYGIKVNGVLLNTIRYADDTLIMCDSMEGLQDLMNRISLSGSKMGLNINVSKTKFMIFSRERHENAHLILNNSVIERVQRFKYLGSIITENLDPDIEIKCRIETARTTFQRMRNLLCDDNLNLKLRQRLVKCYIWSILLYGMEGWTLKVASLNRLEALEMWLHRRVLRIPWTDLLTNTEVLRRANSERQLIINIKCRKIAYLGHVLRGEKYHLLQLVIKGKIEGKRGVGRRRISWLGNIREWTGMREAGELFRMAEDREAISKVIANVRETEHGT